jgi:chromosome segregation protein
VLSAIYIKGFKTFAKPVRMLFEAGVTAIVGPNGSGKSNITDAVLFALGEQSPRVLRAGAMSELIFAGSETLPGAGAAEVTLVLDNEAGEISMPYREVSVTRRISRAGETEYRLNGIRARLADVRAVASEAGLGRHSILRQGAVDSIVAGGAAACRLALEESAGLGVYRRRRLSTSRRLERADAQLERSRQLEAELATQLQRIEREAAVAREYREIEARYRELSLAHLYRVATTELDGIRGRLRAGQAQVAQLSASERSVHEAERSVEERLHDLEEDLRKTEQRLESLEDGAEDLRAETLRSDKLLFHLEASRGREGELRLAIAHLVDELRRVSKTVENLEKRAEDFETERAAKRDELTRLQRVLQKAREHGAAAEKERVRLDRDLEKIWARLARVLPDEGCRVASKGELSRLAAVAERLASPDEHEAGTRLHGLRERVGHQLERAEKLAEETSHRRGALAVAVGRAESRVRALRETAPEESGTRLYELIRARPGYEVAVEAALGDYGAGVLAENLNEGMKILSDAVPVAVRLDAQALHTDGVLPGKPLLECVEILDARYAGAVERLLGGIFVVESPSEGADVNGYVAVTRDGLRLTRTSVSLRPALGSFAREARLSSERDLLKTLKERPGGMLYELRGGLSDASERLDWLVAALQRVSSQAERTARARVALSREAGRRHAIAESSRKDLLEREKSAEALTSEASEVEATRSRASVASDHARKDLAAAAAEADAARAAAAEVDRRSSNLQTTLAEGRRRRAAISRKLEEVSSSAENGADTPELVVGRAARAARQLITTVRERRNALRSIRTESADAHREVSAVRTNLSRRAVVLAGELATVRAETERLAEEVARVEASSAVAAEEIEGEWGATLEVARQESEKHSEHADKERHHLGGKLKRFGDINLLALSQEESLRERYEFVAVQRADAEAAATELNRIIQSVDVALEGRFTETFERVRGAFGEMVPRMLQGASGVLELSEEGVEIGLRLGRKGWRPLRVLSGGERALLALSFLLSVFLSRPGKYSGAVCVLDEAEAALDDLNLARFLSVVDSHRANGQYLLVTHQKRTMAAADVLYGVVQDASGATTVVSKRLQGE